MLDATCAPVFAVLAAGDPLHRKQRRVRCVVADLPARLRSRAMRMLSFCALSLSCSLVQDAAALAVRPSLPHAHHHHSPAALAGGRRVARRSCRKRAASPLVAFAAAGASTSSTEEAAVGYEIDESGRCSGVEALPPLTNRYYALRHGQSVANM